MASDQELLKRYMTSLRQDDDIERARGTGGQPQVPQQSQFQPIQIPEGEASGISAFGQGVRRGVESVGEGILQRGAQVLGLAGIDTQSFLDELERSRSVQQSKAAPAKGQRPVSFLGGQVVGSAGALPVPATGIRQAATVGGGLGAFEFGEEGGVRELFSNTLLGAGFGILGESVSNIVGNSVKKIAKRLGVNAKPAELFDANGALTQNAQEAFDRVGVTLDEVSDQVLSDVKASGKGANIEQALRKSLSEELGITDVTRADITQQFTDQSEEFKLFKNRGTPEADQLRQIKASQNQQIIDAGEAIKQGIGGQEGRLNAGTVIQDALRGSKIQRREAVGQLYEIAEQEAGAAIPVQQEGIANTFNLQDFEFGADPDLAGKLKGVRRQLEVFSVLPPETITNPQDLARIRPLTVSTAERLRQNINTLIPVNDQRAQAILGPIRDSIDDAVSELGVGDTLTGEAREAFLRARQAHRTFKEEFDAKDIINNIVKFKPGTGTDVIPPSIMVDKILKSQNKFENVKLLKRSLNNAGEEGQQAWRDFKTNTLFDVIGQSLRTGKTASGDLKFSGSKLAGALDGIGKDTLTQIFDPREMAAINQLRRVTRDLTILQDGVFTPSGADVENALEKLARSPVISLNPVTQELIDLAGQQIKKGQARRNYKKIISSDVDVDKAEAIGLMEAGSLNAMRLLVMSGLRTGKKEKTERISQ